MIRISSAGGDRRGTAEHKAEAASPTAARRRRGPVPARDAERREQLFEEAHYRGWHLARTPHEAATTDLEWSILRFDQAFERWIRQLGLVVGMGDLSYTELVVLHVIRMQDRPKTAAQIARQLNRDDIANVQYCLRKLVKMGLCRKAGEHSAKTLAFQVTARCRLLTDDYAELRRRILTEQTKIIEDVDQKLRDATKLINLLTGFYDEAARISAAYSLLSTTGDDERS
ncbi:MAG: winged helix DNA-binding protein [Gammaproteobacteria bacterium]|nr:winged helix DNA-binding protein [Gammaproteobacteria bacterium]